MGESQHGQVPIYRTKSEQMPLCPPVQILARRFHVSFLGNPYRENPDD
jgi:hypothetical protein